MLLEAYDYLTTPCKPALRKLGYLYEAVALQARYRRLQGHWQGHMEQCQGLIRLASEQCAQRRRVIVLGSGILAEVPLEYLCRQFDEVVLVDAIHVKGVRRRVAAYSNVTLLEEDINGLSEELLAFNRRSQALPSPRAWIPGLNARTDLVVSANLLSQLYIAPLNYAIARSRFADERYIEWCQAMIRAHMQALLDCHCRVCLFTDLVHEQRNLRGEVIKREDMLLDIKLPDSAWQWRWQLAPAGEVARNYSVSADVSGFINFPYPGY